MLHTHVHRDVHRYVHRHVQKHTKINKKRRKKKETNTRIPKGHSSKQVQQPGAWFEYYVYRWPPRIKMNRRRIQKSKSKEHQTNYNTKIPKETYNAVKSKRVCRERRERQESERRSKSEKAEEWHNENVEFSGRC